MTISISILQELVLSINMVYKRQVFSTISPRYMNDAFGEIKKAIDSGKKTKGIANFTWNFDVTIKSDKKVNFYESPSHQLDLISQSGNEISLKMKKDCIPNKDFIFLYST